MAPTLSQTKRVASLTTSLGKDVLSVTRFDGHEALSQLFEFRIEALSETENIDFDQAIGRNAAVTIETQDNLKRLFNGVVVEARWLGPRDELHAYQIVLRPWLWLLSHTTNCRIFSSKKAPDIIKQIFSDNGFSGSMRDALTGSYPTLEYCVQYRESDMNFVCRLMEEFGIYYYFEHSDDKHMLVLSDAKSSHKPVPGLSSVEFLPGEIDQRRDKQQLGEWSTYRAFQSGRFVLNDYDYLKPNANLIADQDSGSSYEHGSMEVFDYPGRYTEQSNGKTLAKVRLEAEQAKDKRRLGVGSSASLFPGALIKLDRHPTGSENVEYLVLGCTHSFTGQQYRSGGGSDDFYNGVYEFMPSSRPFRAPILTPKPVVRGPQTAKVVGKQGEEIDVDEHGRITVQFYWDRKKDVSRRVRIGQIWSGKNWGGIVIPRVGQEVIVQFLEGDPDQPLVIGTVYNGDNKVPYDLPANKTIAGVKSNSTKGGNGYNEFIFEDKKGSETIRMHAQKDHDVTILNSETEEIGKDFTPPTGSPSRSVKIKNGDDNLVIDMGDLSVKNSLGSQDYNAAQTITMTAGLQIKLTVGASSITIDPTGVTINGPMITVKGAAMVQTQAPMVMTSADGMIVDQSQGMIAMTATLTTITGKSGLLPPLPPTSLVTVA